MSDGLDLSRLEGKVNNLAAEVSNMHREVSAVGNNVNHIQQELHQLRTEFEEMMRRQAHAEIMNRARQELIRVRQEIKDNFGNYAVIRQTMLGVLQATDLALVKKTTISNVSEELMISSPNYWLAPCLVAIAAWIGNDRDLAERAIAEAVSRDEERTALTMALVCRRNGREDTCYEWLSVYFSNQQAAKLSEGSFVYIDAYANGVFGTDKMHLCDDYIGRWLSELQSGDDHFEEVQTDVWKNYCKSFDRGIGEGYSAMKTYVEEYPRIESYAGRVKSAEPIKERFKSITSMEIDQTNLKKTIDEKLIELIKRHNDDEGPLREEEKLYKLIIDLDGDEQTAKARILAEKKAREAKTADLIKQMTDTIVVEGAGTASQRKTAVSFLNNYISKGYQSYIEEKKSDFPNEITIKINEWSGKTQNGENAELLKQDFQKCEEELMEKAQKAAIKKRRVASIIWGVLGLITLFLLPAVGIVFLVIAVILFLKKDKGIAEQYAARIEEGKVKIDSCINEWCDVQQKVNQFNNSDSKVFI